MEEERLAGLTPVSLKHAVNALPRRVLQRLAKAHDVKVQFPAVGSLRGALLLLKGQKSHSTADVSFVT